MTLASRNNVIRIATFMVLALTLLSLTVMVLLHLRGLENLNVMKNRPPGPHFSLTPYAPAAVLAGIVVFPLVSLVTLGYILFAFEKTQTTEITFFAAGIFAIALESFRIIIPLNEVWANTTLIVTAISRIALFCRLFTVLCLLSSIIFTTGQTSQQIGAAIFLTAFFSLSLVNAVPFNAINSDTTYYIMPGYSRMIHLVLALLGVLAASSYRIQGSSRGIPEYSRAATGVLFILTGYGLLTVADSWIVTLCGAASLSAGSWRYLKQIHRYYLWQ